MFDLQKFNDLLGTNFDSIDEITDHQLLAALVALTAASLGVSIFMCNPTYDSTSARRINGVRS